MGLGNVGWHRWDSERECLISYSGADLGITPDSDLKAFAEDHAGNLWMGFSSTQLVRYAGGRFQAFTERQGLPRGSISSLHVDQTGRLWVGSSESGLFRIENPSADRPRIVSFTRAQGLGGSRVSTVIEDLWGRIYAATGRGLDRLDPSTGRIEHFTMADGLCSESVNHSFRDRNGTLWFATSEGLSRFDPEPPSPRRPIHTIISGLRIRGIAQPISELGQAAVAIPDLAAQQNQIQIDFASLNFDPERVLSYQYRLIGADRAWSMPTNTRTVNYASLKPGQYRFIVRALDGGDERLLSPAAQTATVDFTVLPPLWARWWFAATAAALFGLLVFGGHCYRVRNLMALEGVRARIAADLHDDIGASLSQIAILTEVARSQLSGEEPRVAGPLGEIAEISSEVIDSTSDMVWAINPKRDHLSDLVHRVRRFSGDMLGGRDIALNFRTSEVSVDPILGPEVRHHVLLIAKEAVNNVARHSGATQAVIDLEWSPKYLILRVCDNGCGFDDSCCAAGNGLSNMRRRAAMLDGSVEFDTAPGEGTRVKVTISL
jgi:hypothetical protein